MIKTDNLTEQEILTYLNMVNNIRARAELSGNRALANLADRDIVNLSKALTPFKTGEKQ